MRRCPIIRRRPTRRCSIRIASTRSCAGTSRATRRRWWSASPVARRRHSCAVCEAITHNSGRERTGAFCYAVGWTIIHPGADHSCRLDHPGSAGQYRPAGGGILALRGHCSIQGSTDIPTLYNMLPTYLPQPNALKPAPHAEAVPQGRDGADRLVAQPAEIHDQPAEGLVRRARAARQRVRLRYLPKLTGDHSQLPMTLAMVDGVLKGQFMLGQNPVVGAVNSDLVQRGLRGSSGWWCAISR